MSTVNQTTEPTGLAPVEAPARIASLDVMRGLAVLGILAVTSSPSACPSWSMAMRTSAPFL